MVDTETYKKMHAEDEASTERVELTRDAMLEDDGPSKLEYPSFFLLLPMKIRAYGFHNKKWSKHHKEDMGTLTNACLESSFSLST